MAEQLISPIEAEPRSNDRAVSFSQHAAGRSAQPPTRQPRHKYRLLITAVVIIAVIVGAFIYAGSQPDTQTSGAGLAPASLVHQLTSVSPSVITGVGTGGLSNPLARVTSAQPLRDPTGKPQILYIGAEYCPFCAAERWSLIVALSRFGTFQHLQLTTSSASDLYPNTSTFTFYRSAYTSPYLDFQSVEEATRDQNIPLQTPTASQKQLLRTYDATPYIPADKAGGIPFVDLGNQYVTVGAGFSPQVLSSLSWQQIASRLDNANDPVAKNIVGNANYLTAAICEITANQPESVCAAGPIPQIQQRLAQEHHP